MTATGQALGATWDARLAPWSARLAPRTERVPIDRALGRLLAADAVATRPSPPVRCAAMDGIAVRAAETAAGRLPAGSYVPVDTGTPVPTAYDAVVMIEDVEPLADGTCLVRRRAAPGDHLRLAGEDVAPGELLLAAGSVLAPTTLALLLAGGVAVVEVTTRPRVAVVPTGDEVRPLAVAGAGDVVDSNGPMIGAILAAAGCTAAVGAPVADRAVDLHDALGTAAEGADLVVVLAGTSRGGRDLVPHAVAELGGIDVRGLPLRPGGPTLLGRLGATPVACLPGYPVAAWAVAQLVVVPALAALGGLPVPAPRPARLLGPAAAHERLATAYPARLATADDATSVVEILPRRSSRLSALRSADALVVVPAGTPREAGEVVLARPAR